MRSFAVRTYDIDAPLECLDVPIPQPKPGEVRIRIEATALGFVDGLMVQGRYQIKPPLPYVPGGEIAGIVDAVGDGVACVRVGERVVTWQLGGGLADYVVVPAVDVDVLDEGISAVTAASMLVDYQTAHHGLFDRGHVGSTDAVLVLGAAGGVGAAAVQMAARTGATVIAAASTAEKREFAQALGARHTIDYLAADWRAQLRAKAPEQFVDVVFDTVGGDMLEPAFRSLGKTGRYLVVGFAAGRVPSLPVNLALLKSAALLGVEIRHFLHTEPARAKRVRSALFSQVRTGALLPPRTTRFPLEQAAAAVKATASRTRAGKVVVEVSN
ncbi:NADPH:quinone oxidoreductase family protein [Variovorax sp. ZT4R33]|uniref:NADPH:quinone oxidoreductase family protein n=1 Tax=Variovorax sp. ZT4R33 TaxID=3443743 RepID=UPI003F4776DC